MFSTFRQKYGIVIDPFYGVNLGSASCYYFTTEWAYKKNDNLLFMRWLALSSQAALATLIRSAAQRSASQLVQRGSQLQTIYNFSVNTCCCKQTSPVHAWLGKTVFTGYQEKILDWQHAERLHCASQLTSGNVCN